jgi:HTH-type transcriptional regulator, sugar sensing transcriptional regulator
MKAAALLLTTMVVNSNQLIEHMSALGFSEYEARAYAALLACHDVSAYELARQAGVPSSKIYQVLARLVAHGLAQADEQAGRRRYIPLDSVRFIADQRGRLELTLKQLQAELGESSESRDVSYIWNIREGRGLLERACSIIASARHSLLVSLWPEEYEDLREELGKARRRRVRMAAVVFGRLPAGRRLRGLMIHAHPIEDTLYAEKGGRGLSLVADSREALTATLAGDTGAVEGAWSLNRGFVNLAEDYIKHDIYIMKVVRRFDAELVGRFGPGYRRLRDVYSDGEEA